MLYADNLFYRVYNIHILTGCQTQNHLLINGEFGFGRNELIDCVYSLFDRRYVTLDGK